MLILEICISFVFIFLTLSILASSMAELWAGINGDRGKFLKHSIQRMLIDVSDKKQKWWKNLFSNISVNKAIRKFDNYENIQGEPETREYREFFREFSEHVLIHQIQRLDGKWPSYLSKARFSQVIIGLVVDPSLDTNQGISYQTLKASIQKVPESNSNLKKVLTQLFSVSDGDPTAFQNQLEAWFQETQDRVAGWYKRQVRYRLFVIGIVMAVGINIDAVAIFQELNSESQAAELIANTAEKLIVTIEAPEENSITSVDQLSERIGLVKEIDSILTSEEVYIPIGWPVVKNTSSSFWETWGIKILGWLITALAMSMGATFWFDVLDKLIRIRHAGILPRKDLPKNTRPQQADLKADRNINQIVG